MPLARASACSVFRSPVSMSSDWMMRLCVLISLSIGKFAQYLPNFQHTLAHPGNGLVNAQPVLAGQAIMLFFLDQLDYALRVNRRIATELHDNGCGTGINFQQIERLAQQAKAVAVHQGLRGCRDQAEAIYQLFLQLVQHPLRFTVCETLVDDQALVHLWPIGLRPQRPWR